MKLTATRNGQIVIWCEGHEAEAIAVALENEAAAKDRHAEKMLPDPAYYTRKDATQLRYFSEEIFEALRTLVRKMNQ